MQAGCCASFRIRLIDTDLKGTNSVKSIDKRQ